MDCSYHYHFPSIVISGSSKMRVCGGCVSPLASVCQCLIIFCLTSSAHETIVKQDHCATLSVQLYRCGSCNDTQSAAWDVNGKAGETASSVQFRYTHVASVLSVKTSENCYMTLCDGEDLTGYCAHYHAGITAKLSDFEGIFQSDLLTGQCTCKNEPSELRAQDDEHFSRNYVGVVVSPYDKYWEGGPNGTKKRVEWKNYTLDEIRTGLETIATKFSYISTYGMGTVSNSSEWYEGDKIAFVPKLSAEINAKAGFPLLRVSVGIFRKDDVNLKWKSKELLNAMDAAKDANALYNGTVWGITVTSQYLVDSEKTNDVQRMIAQVREINEREKLYLKVGIRLDKCKEFIATKRPEDDASTPTYQDPDKANSHPLTTFQSDLQDVAKKVDYILCLYTPPVNYLPRSIPSLLKLMQKDSINIRKSLQKINPKLKLFVETGIPSQGTGNGIENSLTNLRQYWYSMAKFAKQEHIPFHMLEATDQPWKNIQDGSEREDINGPNGTDAFHGWWRRANNSLPAVYIEKIQDIKDENDDYPGLKREIYGDVLTSFEKITPLTKVVIVIFLGFTSIILSCTGYLWWKLRKAERNVISRAYIQLFHCGGDDASSATDGNGNYAVALKIPYDREFEMSKENFFIDKSVIIGSGQGGVVYRGTIKGRLQPVAFKSTTTSSSVADVKNIMSEIKILSYIGAHQNVVCILGAYTKKIQRGIVYLTLEYCPMGSLEDFLHQIDFSRITTPVNDLDQSPGCTLGVLNPGYVSTLPDPGYILHSQLNEIQTDDQSSPQSPGDDVHEVNYETFLKWSYQIASAMEFVAEKKVIHSDLAVRNILMASVNQVKIADFGLSRKLYQEIGVVHHKDTLLPWRWMAPESLKNRVFLVESDVWSYGVTVWEIFSLAEVPYHGISYDMNFVEMLQKGMRLPRAKFSTNYIHEQLLQCWACLPQNRPSFTDMKKTFELLASKQAGLMKDT